VTNWEKDLKGFLVVPLLPAKNSFVPFTLHSVADLLQSFLAFFSRFLHFLLQIFSPWLNVIKRKALQLSRECGDSIYTTGVSLMLLN
jgi:hypothetical protein